MVAVLVGPASQSFAADETSAAREHAQKAKAFMDLGKYGEAAAEYEAAYADKQDPTLLLNLAQAYRLAGNGNKAIFFYRKYLQHVPKSPYRADIEEKITALEKAGASGNVTPPPAGDNPVTPPPTTPPGGPTTSPTPPSGPAAGPGSNQTNQLSTPPGAPPGAPPDNNPVVSPLSPPPEIPGTAPSPGAEPIDHGKNLRLAGLVTGGVGAISLVVGAIFGGAAKDAQRNVEKTANAGGTFDPSEDERGRSAQTREITFIVIGAAALAAGGVIYYLGARHPVESGSPPPGSVALLPSAAPNRMGAALRVTF
jgi:hypothetical protein